jgi:hypothetical protein
MLEGSEAALATSNQRQSPPQVPPCSTTTIRPLNRITILRNIQRSSLPTSSPSANSIHQCRTLELSERHPLNSSTLNAAHISVVPAPLLRRHRRLPRLLPLSRRQSSRLAPEFITSTISRIRHHVVCLTRFKSRRSRTCFRHPPYSPVPA